MPLIRDPVTRAIDEMLDERAAQEAELSDETYTMWESTEECRCCGSTERHGVPAKWVACGNCGSENF